MPSELVVDELVVRYGPTQVVHGVSFVVHGGELVTLLGPSGCGKTTTLRCVAGLEPAHSGRISLDGRVLSNGKTHMPPESRGINMVFQSYAIWPHMTVFDNVAYGLRVRSMRRQDTRDRVMSTLDMVGLADYAQRYGTELSGGQQQRVAVARAIATQPQMLLFDEPLSNLDSALRERLRFEMVELQRRIGTTSLYVTHDQAEAMAMSDRIVLLNGGRVEQIGSPSDVYERPVSRFAAELVGRANFLTGTVSSVAGDRTDVSVGGAAVTASLIPQVPRPALGDEVTLFMRPEHLTIHPAAAPAAADNMWQATLTHVTYVGSRLECRADSLGHGLRLVAPSGSGVHAGDVVSIGCDAASLIVLGNEPERRDSAEKEELTSI
jgi:iron(III) transport system ATP-binding protein